MRILLSEGQSTSAREAVTALGLSGHEVEVADPSPLCFCRFSRFVRKVHRVPPIASDPLGYLDAIVAILEQPGSMCSCRSTSRDMPLPRRPVVSTALAAVALPSFDAYDAIFRKYNFSRLLAELGISQPEPKRLSRSINCGSDHFPSC